MTLQRYEILNKVVEVKNITKAGQKLNLTQSTVSHAIKSLEDELGFDLLVRSRSGITLTREGERIYQYTRKIMNLNDSLLQEASALSGLETGIIKVGTFASVTINWMPKIINTFKNKFPGISIEFIEDDYESLEKGVMCGELDCCFTIDSPNKTIQFTPLKKDKMYCIVSKENLLHKQSKVKLTQLEEYPLIKPQQGWDYEISTYFHKNNIHPNVEYEITDDQSIIAMVQANVGIAIRPKLVIKNMPPYIVPLELEKEAFRIIGIGFSDQVSPAAKKFINTVVDLYQDIEQYQEN